MDLIKKYFENQNFNVCYILLQLHKNKFYNQDEYKKIYLETLLNIDTDLLTKEEKNIISEHTKDQIKVLLMCNWCSNKELCDIWNKMSKGNYTWNNIKIVWEEPCDYYCIINKPLNDNIYFDPKRTILFRMEPLMENNVQIWGEKWSTNFYRNEFKYFGSHDIHYNNNEWHISKTYNQLLKEKIIKNEKLSNILSTILSSKYNDPGQKKRIDFVKFIENKGDIIIDVYGQNSFNWKNYKGFLPYHQKDDSLLSYKYTFNCENNNLNNYYTEKIIDGILSECLVFYSGCPNIKDFIDPEAFIYLELEDFEKDYQIIKKAIEDDLWSKKLPFIKKAKEKILKELQFFPRLEKIINN